VTGVQTCALPILVACALISGETTEDYEWILEQLLESNNNLAPGVILVDEDPAMEAACVSRIPATAIINCIWHLASLSLNIPKNLRSGSNWDEFIRRFWTARNALTADEFERRWSALAQQFGGTNRPRINSYLQRLFDRREHWAWAWTGVQFTAGMQSTQRVEKTHHLIKQATADRMTPLKRLFEIIEQKISDEKRTSEYINLQAQTSLARVEHQFAAKVFSRIEKVNSKYLAKFALFRMRTEMTLATFYRHRVHINSESMDEEMEMKDIAVRFLFLIIFTAKS